MQPTSSLKSPKKPQKIGTSRKSKIPVKIAAEARVLFISGESLSTISRRFPQHSRDQLRCLQEKENWDEQRNKYRQELEASADDDLAFAKVALRQAILSLVRASCDKINNGEVKIVSMRDVERLAFLVGLIDPKGKEEPKFDASLRVEEPDVVEKVLRYIAERKGIYTEE